MAGRAPSRPAEVTTGRPGGGVRGGSTITTGMPWPASQARWVPVGRVRTSSTPALSRMLTRSSQTGGGPPFPVRPSTVETTRSTPVRQAASSMPCRAASA
ncbi:hypothetical protein ACIBCT_34205 [Streptosporangium sp. NPDC050855]|uniref:hypothetical protein n=1 Tax=Streptosporangium sp. NPDC050855 TaxID=3366194 RepID=UPI00378F8C39